MFVLVILGGAHRGNVIVTAGRGGAGWSLGLAPACAGLVGVALALTAPVANIVPPVGAKGFSR